MKRRGIGLVGVLVAVAVMGTAGLAFGARELVLMRLLGDGYLSGMLLGEDGRPMAKMPVTLIVQRSSGLDCSTGQCAEFNIPVFIQSAVTDSEGRFALHVPGRFLAERGKPNLYIARLRVDLALLKVKFFYGLNLYAREANVQTFEVKPPYWQPA